MEEKKDIFKDKCSYKDIFPNMDFEEIKSYLVKRRSNPIRKV